MPAETGDTERLSPKLIVAATPICDPLSCTEIPVPTAVTPVSAEPSSAGRAPVRLDAASDPEKEVAVTTPVTFNPPALIVIPEPTTAEVRVAVPAVRALETFTLVASM